MRKVSPLRFIDWEKSLGDNSRPWVPWMEAMTSFSLVLARLEYII